MQENGKLTEKLIFTKDKQKWVINKIKDCYGENGSTADRIAEFMHEKGKEIRKSSDPSHDTPKKDLNIEKTEKLVEKVSKYAGLMVNIFHELEQMQKEVNIDGLHNITSYSSKNNVAGHLKEIVNCSNNLLKQRKALEEDTIETENRGESIPFLVENIGVA